MNRLATVLGVWLLMRPANAAMAAAGVVAGAVAIAFGRPDWASTSLGAAAAFLGVAGANALNDFYDASLDARAHPDRPVPRGMVSAKTARVVGWLLLAVAVVAAWTTNPFAGALATVLAAGLVGYELSLKERGLVGHATVSLAVASTVVLGLAVGNAPPFSYPLPKSVVGSGTGAGTVRSYVVLGFAAVAFFANLGRELFKSVQDMVADAPTRATYAVRMGPAHATRLARGSLVAALALGAAVFGGLGWSMERTVLGLIVYGGVVVPFVVAAIRREASGASRWTKVGMAIALLGFVALVLL